MTALVTQLRSPGGLPYAIHEGPYFTFNSEGAAEASVIYRVAVGQTFAFISELMPPPEQPDLRSPLVIRKPTWKLPNIARIGNARFLSPISADVRPFPDSKPIDPWFNDQTATAGEDDENRTRSKDAASTNPNVKNSSPYAPFVLIDVRYNTNIDSMYTATRRSDKPLTFLEASKSETAELLTINANNRNVKSIKQSVSSSPNLTGGQQIKELTAPICKLIPIIDLQFTWKWALNPDWDSISALVGCVNQYKYGWLPGADYETVMFTGMSARQQWRIGRNCEKAIETWEITYHFKQKQITENSETYGWNHIYNPDAQGFTRLSRDAPGAVEKPLYPLVDFARLFRAAV